MPALRVDVDDDDDKDDQDERPEYEVRKIASKRTVLSEDGEESVEYLVDWEPTWMSADEVGNHESVRQFEEKTKGKGKKAQSESAPSASSATSELDEFKLMIRVGVEAGDLQKTVYGRKLYDRVLGCMYFGVSTTEHAKECLSRCFSVAYSGEPATVVYGAHLGACGACGMFRALSYSVPGFGKVGSDCKRRLIAARVMFSYLHNLSRAAVTQAHLDWARKKEAEMMTMHADRP